MTPAFLDRVEAYIALRRHLGNRLTGQARLLRSFGRFVDGLGHTGPLTIDLALRWARSPCSKDPNNDARRLATIRGYIHSFARYASFRDPASLPILQRLLAIPSKRFDRPVLEFLTREEVNALLASPDLATWSGQRDAVLFALLYNTGARLSEITGLRVGDVRLDREACVHLHGKGRKERLVPLWKGTDKQVDA